MSSFLCSLCFCFVASCCWFFFLSFLPPRSPMMFPFCRAGAIRAPVSHVRVADATVKAHTQHPAAVSLFGVQSGTDIARVKTNDASFETCLGLSDPRSRGRNRTRRLGLNAPVQRTGACRTPDRALLRVPRVSSTRDRPEKWTGAHESKAPCANRLPASLSAKRTAAFGISVPYGWSIAVRRYSSRLAWTIEETTGGRVSRDLIYTYLSRRGEVAEWLKAAVC